MMVILPRKKGDLTSVERVWSARLFQTILADVSEEKGTITIPKFRTKARLSQHEILLETMLDLYGKFDYAGIFKDRPWRPTALTHSVDFGIDEEGTTGASASGSTDNVSLSTQPFEFVADHPFLYVVFDQKTKAILYMGRYSGDPAK